MGSGQLQLITFFVALETELQSIEPEWVEYFPVIRSYVYLNQRLEGRSRATSKVGPFIRNWPKFGVQGVTVLLQGLISGISAEQLFVAPASHRHVLRDGRYYSKHLDSLVNHFGGDRDLVWEVGQSTTQGLGGVQHNPSTYLWPAAVVLSRLKPLSRGLRRISEVIERVRWSVPNDISLNTRSLLRNLAAFEICRSYYRRLFRYSELQRCYIVVYYSQRNLPLISVLNSYGIETIEYQHGIQNDMHPLYTNWEHLAYAPSTLVNRVLVWDEVSRNRIDNWGKKLGIVSEITGNLWYAGGSPAKIESGTPTVLVALQLYPDYFNKGILRVVAELRHVRWIFREHPIHPLFEQDRADLLRSYSNIEVLSARDESLEDSLKRSVCCITGYSTVGVEALLYGRVTIFTNSLAREGLGAYIDNERCFYADTAGAIRNVLDKVLKPSSL